MAVEAVKRQEVEDEVEDDLEGGDVSSTHPDYDAALDDWELIRDCIGGETVVKDRGELYLPKPSGFTAQPDSGEKMYTSYILRAKFPEIMGPTLRGMVGIIHRISADITLPDKLEPIREIATKDGLPLDALHERITYELLATGRYGLLVDAPEEGSEIPYIAGYKAETIINWDNLKQDFYVLDESHLARKGFQWEDVDQYRVLRINPKTELYEQIVYGGDESGGSTEPAEPIEPKMQGGGKWDEIPFVVIGSTDVTPEIDEIPLMSIARSAFTMYRLFADYFWQLFMSGQETLFVISDTEQPVTTVGAGVVINIPSTSDAKYVGPSGQGIAAHKEAIMDEREQALIAGARIFDTGKKTAESGEALKMRWTAQTASLTTVALNSAKGLEKALKYAASFIGANPDEVVVSPNLSFIDSTLSPDKAYYLVQMWMAGAISGLTLWENLQKGDIGTYDRTWDEEKELIDQEMPDVLPPSPTGNTPTVPPGVAPKQITRGPQPTVLKTPPQPKLQGGKQSPNSRPGQTAGGGGPKKSSST